MTKNVKKIQAGTLYRNMVEEKEELIEDEKSSDTVE